MKHRDIKDPAPRKQGSALFYTCPVPGCAFAAQAPLQAEASLLREIRLHNKTLAANEERSCRDCGRGYPAPDGRGRPPVRCETCRSTRKAQAQTEAMRRA